MAVAGKAQRPRVEHLLNAAAGVDGAEGQSVITEIVATVADLPRFADRSACPKPARERSRKS